MDSKFKRLLYNFAALGDLGQEITSSHEFEPKMRTALHVIMGTFLNGSGAIYSSNRKGEGLATGDGKGGKMELVPIAVKGFGSDDGDDLPRTLPLDGLSEAPELIAPGPITSETPALEGLRAAGAEVFAPLVARDKLVGVLVLGGKFNSEPYCAEDFELLGVIASQVAITLHNHTLFLRLTEKLDENRRLYEEMRLIYHDTIQAFATAIDAKDVYTKQHSYRVASYSVAIARELGWSENDIEGIYIAGLLHDVGKIVLRDDILNKQAPLTESEIKEIKKHPNLSYEILSKIKFPWKDVVDIIRHHHERPDGTGYPDSLNDSTLSDGAKVLSLADSFDAMTTDRPYRKKMDLEAALMELKENLISQFDSRIAGAFVQVLEREISNGLDSPEILPHLATDFDPTVIHVMLKAIKEELKQK